MARTSASGITFFLKKNASTARGHPQPLLREPIIPIGLSGLPTQWDAIVWAASESPPKQNRIRFDGIPKDYL
ncbi:unnamed protein product [Caenorhabditis brenneri]